MKLLESQVVGIRYDEDPFDDLWYPSVDLPTVDPDDGMISADAWLDEWDDTTKLLPGHTFVFGSLPDPGLPEGLTPSGIDIEPAAVTITDPVVESAQLDDEDEVEDGTGDDSSFLVTGEHEIVVAHVDPQRNRRGLGGRLRSLFGRD